MLCMTHVLPNNTDFDMKMGNGVIANGAGAIQTA